MADFPGEKKREVWEKRWEQGRTGFHSNKVDDRLKKYIHDVTGDRADASVLVTWCGKSLDVPWLCSKGYNTVGVELSEIGVRELFVESNIPYTSSKECDFVAYKASDRSLKVFAGNFYKLTPDIAGIYECIWDKNALGAAEPKDRVAYQSVLVSLLQPGGRVLLSNFEFNDQGRDRAPYSVSPKQINDLFDENFDVKFLENPEENVKIFMNTFKVEWAKQNIHLLTLK